MKSIPTLSITRMLLAAYIICFASVAQAAFNGFSASNHSSSAAKVLYSEKDRSESIALPPKKDTIVVWFSEVPAAFEAIETVAFRFDLRQFDHAAISSFWFVVVSEDEIHVFPSSRVAESLDGGFEFEDPETPLHILKGKKKAAEPGATDNPDDAQRV